MSWTIWKELQLRYWRAVERAAGQIDEWRYRYWKRFQNGSVELQQAYEAVDDTADCLDAVESALEDGDYFEALRLVRMSKERLKDHVTTLRGLL
jgi:hypothetical protein